VNIAVREARSSSTDQLVPLFDVAADLMQCTIDGGVTAMSVEARNHYVVTRFASTACRLFSARSCSDTKERVSKRRRLASSVYFKVDGD
jgi:hypothetical protein